MPAAVTPLVRGELAAALGDADLRVLLMCMFHVTGDRRWMRDPFRPQRDVRLIADEGAGLSPAAAAELRAAALELFTSADVLRPAFDDPGDACMVEMMRWCMDEPVDAAYAPMMREDLGFTDRAASWSTDPPDGRSQRHVVIVGAGASGMIVAARLRQLDIPFTVLERSDDVGGTWRDNTYPGAGVDTPNHAYSYSIGRRHPWSRNFSPQPELHDYLRERTDEFGIRDHIRFGHTVAGVTWNDDLCRWHVRVDHTGTATTSWATTRSSITCTDLIVAIGQFGLPSIPDIEGLSDFEGPIFHTTEWPDDLDVAGKRVTLIGTGASAMQIAPTIAPSVARLTIHQRSPQWARPIPRYHDRISDGTQWLLEHVPFYAQWFRFTMLWRYGDGLLPFLRIDPDWPHPERSLNRVNDKHRSEMVTYIEAELGDRTDLLDVCVPTYPPYGKRILLDNGWYSMLRRPEVDLVSGPVQRITATGTVDADGVERDADVIVLSTGFRMTDMARAIHPVGRDGATLDDVWGHDDATAHLGITVPGFPNMYLMQGPSTGLGHGGSAIFQAESQTKYITDAIVRSIESNIAAIDVRRDVHDDFVRIVDERHAEMIWSHPGMSTYYRNAHGRVVSVTPFSLLEYWQMTHQVDLTEYHHIHHHLHPSPPNA